LCQFRTIPAALQAAVDGDQISVAGGTYRGPISIDKSVNVIGAGATETTILGEPSARGSGPVVSVSAHVSVTIGGVTVTGGYWSPVAGGGIHNEGALVVENSIISGNQGQRGGGIYTLGPLLLSGSVVRDNDGGNGVGGIHNGNGVLTLRGSAVIGNVGGSAGGISNEGTAEIMDSRVTDNESAHDGGGITNYGVLAVTRSSLQGNIANGGSGIWNWDSGTVTVSDSTVSDNIGAAGIVNAGKLTVRGSVVARNLTNRDIGGSDGGGIANWGEAMIYETTISGNSGLVNGHHYSSAGGFYNGGNAEFTRVVISGNDAQAQGGGIRNAATGTMSLVDSKVSGNAAHGLGSYRVGGFGGGIYNLGALTLTGTNVSGNTPDDCVGCPSNARQSLLPSVFSARLR